MWLRREGSWHALVHRPHTIARLASIHREGSRGPKRTLSRRIGGGSASLARANVLSLYTRARTYERDNTRARGRARVAPDTCSLAYVHAGT